MEITSREEPVSICKERESNIPRMLTQREEPVSICKERESNTNTNATVFRQPVPPTEAFPHKSQASASLHEPSQRKRGRISHLTSRRPNGVPSLPVEAVESGSSRSNRNSQSARETAHLVQKDATFLPALIPPAKNTGSKSARGAKASERKIWSRGSQTGAPKYTVYGG